MQSHTPKNDHLNTQTHKHTQASIEQAQTRTTTQYPQHMYIHYTKTQHNTHNNAQNHKRTNAQ